MGKKGKNKSLTKGERNPALLAQPAPKSDAADVWPMVVKDMQDRDHLGKVKYGIPLRVHNGRDALVDAYQEVLDLSVYLRQEIEERELLRSAVEEVKSIPGYEKTTVSTLGKAVQDLVTFCSELRNQNRALSASLMHYKTGSQYITGFDDGVDSAIRTVELSLGHDIGEEVVEKVYADSGVKRQQ